MTVWTKKPQIGFTVILCITVFVIYLNWNLTRN